MKKIIIIVVIIIVAVGAYLLNKSLSNDTDGTKTPNVTTNTTQTGNGQTGETEDKDRTIIGKSVEGRDIVAYHYGEGDTELLFVGGIHGGYGWNAALVAYETMDYLEKNPSVVANNIKVTVIPVLNPDGLSKVVGTTSRFAAADVSTSRATLVSGRFNANNVDLNRNFDCDWQSTGKWQNKSVSGGSKPFSEPESAALKAYVDAQKPSAVVAWYSAAGGVFASSCRNGVLPETLALTNAFAKASGYPAYESFDFYEITGDMVNWFAKNKIPAISVLLTNYSDTEWNKNRAGIDAVLKYYTK